MKINVSCICLFRIFVGILPTSIGSLSNLVQLVLNGNRLAGKYWIIDFVTVTNYQFYILCRSHSR